MASPKPHRTSPDARVPRCDVPIRQSDLRSPGEMQRWADLVADAEVGFPENLDVETETRLVEEVRRRRRARLVRYIAGAIAQEILRTHGH